VGGLEGSVTYLHVDMHRRWDCRIGGLAVGRLARRLCRSRGAFATRGLAGLGRNVAKLRGVLRSEEQGK
jgi:hypothetical protein